LERVRCAIEIVDVRLEPGIRSC
jgi:hypothetical protein